MLPTIKANGGHLNTTACRAGKAETAFRYGTIKATTMTRVRAQRGEWGRGRG